jgi:hypothetical protein
MDIVALVPKESKGFNGCLVSMLCYHFFKVVDEINLDVLMEGSVQG